jgi:hypothetical protein
MPDTPDLFPTQAGHDPGGKVRLRDTTSSTRRAFFSADGVYRYGLEIVCQRPLGLPTGLFIMMNPSTADETHNDPTVAKIMRYAWGWGWGTLLVGNTFAYRATDQRRLLQVSDPIGQLNDHWLEQMALRADCVIMAYGQPKSVKLRARGPAVAAMLRAKGHRLHVLELANDGTPKHPLFLRGDLKPVEWKSA